LIRISEEEELADGKTEYKSADYKKLAMTIVGKSTMKPLSEFFP